MNNKDANKCDKLLNNKSIFLDVNVMCENKEAQCLIINLDWKICALDKFQKIYINFLYDNIIKNLNIDIDNECLAMTKAVKECQDKNMSVDEIKQNYIPYYLKHYYELIKDDLSS